MCPQRCLLAFLLGVGQLGLGGTRLHGEEGMLPATFARWGQPQHGNQLGQIGWEQGGRWELPGGGQGANVAVTEPATLPPPAGWSAAVGTAEAGCELPAPASAIRISLHLTNGVFIFFLRDVISCLEGVCSLIYKFTFSFPPCILSSC